MTAALKSIGNASGFWFILPCVLVLALTSLYPVGFGLVVSLTNWNWLSADIAACRRLPFLRSTSILGGCSRKFDNLTIGSMVSPELPTSQVVLSRYRETAAGMHLSDPG